jgi:hypothetical protein
VAFQTTAENLGGPRLGGSNVYAYDRETDTVKLVTRAP